MKISSNVLVNKVLSNIIFHYFTIFAFIAFFTWAIFYYDFYPLANAEPANFMLPSHWVNENLETWSTFYMGYRNSISLNHITFFISYFLNYNFPFPFLTQYIFFFTMFSLGVLGFNKLLSLFDNFQDLKISRIYISLIILINPAFLYFLNRFQYVYLSLYLLFPLILYLSIKVFESRNTLNFLKYTILINVFLSLNSIIYASIPTLVMLFIFWTMLIIFYLYKNIKNLFFYKKVVLFFSIWFLLNSFWVVPFFIENIFQNKIIRDTNRLDRFGLDINSNLYTLNYFSERDSVLINLLSLYGNNRYEYIITNFQIIENFFYLVNLIPFFIICYAVYYYFKFSNLTFTKKFKKLFNSRFVILFYLFILNFLIIRGTNFPLGIIFEFLFKNLFFLQIYRNVFEKGLIFYSVIFLIIFSLSLIFLIRNNKTNRYVYFALMFYLILNLYPILSSKILTVFDKEFYKIQDGFKVEVPNYYKEISSIVSLSSNFKSSNSVERTLILPLVYEGIIYKWEKGYIGADFLGLISKYDYSYVSPDPIEDRVDILQNLQYAKSKESLLSMYNFKYLVFRDDFIEIDERSSQNLLPTNDLKSYFINNLQFNLENFRAVKNISINLGEENRQKNYSEAKDISFFIRKQNNKLTFFLDEKNYDMFSSPVILFFELENNIQDQSIEIKYKNSNSKNVFKLEHYPTKCEFCYITEPIFVSKGLVPESLTLVFKTKFTNSYWSVKNISYANELTKRETEISNLYSKNKASLYYNDNFSLFNSTDSYKLYDNFLYFIYNEVDSKRYTYISKDTGDMILLNKKLNKANVKYTKISEAEYEISIFPDKNDGKPINTILTFNSTADVLWKLIYPDEFIFGRRTFSFDKNHFLSNTYSNSYLVENIPEEGIRLKLVYLPYYYFKVFSIISILTIIFLILYFFYLLKFKNIKIIIFKKKKNK